MSRLFPLPLLVLLVAACPVAAGQTSTQTSGMPSSQQVDRNGDRLPTEEQRDFNRKVLRGEPVAPERPHDPRLAEAQIREDFRSLQIINNQLQASAARGEAQSQELAKPLAEIRKRAKRLRANLALGAVKAEEEAPKPGGEASVGALLGGLDESVKSFVTNPMFGSIKVFDVALTRKARADLDRVIDLCGVIADRLRGATR